MPDQLSNDLASLRITSTTDGPDTSGRKWWVLGILALLLAVAGAWKFGYPLVEARVFKSEVGFTEVLLVSPAHSTTELTATGYITPQSISRVVARLPGRVAQVLVKEGDRVPAGQVLLQLEDTDQRALIAAAHSRVMANEARAHVARANAAEVRAQLARNDKLVAAGAGMKATTEDLQARLKALEATARAAEVDVKVAQAEVQTARVNLGLLTIKAPIAGTIIAKPPEPGEPAGPTVPSIEIADFSTLQVEADVPEARLHMIKIGGPAEVGLDAFPGRRYRGQVSAVGRKVNRQKASVTVKVKFVDTTEGALPDMSARVSFLSKELDVVALKEPAKVVLPEGAITERGGAKVVFVVDADGMVRMTPVTLGPRTEGGFELTRGPTPGTRLVKNPPSTLEDGRSVREKKD